MSDRDRRMIWICATLCILLRDKRCIYWYKKRLTTKNPLWLKFSLRSFSQGKSRQLALDFHFCAPWRHARQLAQIYVEVSWYQFIRFALACSTQWRINWEGWWRRNHSIYFNKTPCRRKYPTKGFGKSTRSRNVSSWCYCKPRELWNTICIHNKKYSISTLDFLWCCMRCWSWSHHTEYCRCKFSLHL
jgi:hypothetical protein